MPLNISLDIGTALRHFSLIFGLTVGAFGIVTLLTPAYHRLLIKWGMRKQLRDTAADGKLATIFLSLHKEKHGTPTMGGLLIWGVVALVVLISPLAQWLGITRYSLLNRNETYLPLFTLVATGVLGIIDDYLNIKGGVAKGLRVKPKFLWLTLFAVLGGVWFNIKLGFNSIHIPGIGDAVMPGTFDVGGISLSIGYILLFSLVVVASANAVNFTDGLDGLAGGLIIISFTALGLIAYSQGLIILTAFCALITGTTLAFLWFNIPPALFYMGDTGALALGATMGVIAMLTNSVLILPFVAFIFVIEGMSSSLQLLWKKLFNKKLFLIAPLHHHFEALGWPEEKVVMRFWIIGAFMAVLGVILGFLSLLSGVA